MANMHVRQALGSSYEVVCHFPISAANNAAGLAWRTAYARDKGVLATVLPDGTGTLGTISAAEKTAVTVAPPSVAEVVLAFPPPGDWATLTGPQRQARLNEWYTAVEAEFQATNQRRLNWSGYTQ